MPDEMTKLLGALLPLLMGGNITSVLQNVFGVTGGATSNDFLSSTINMQASDAAKRFGLGPNIGDVRYGADKVVTGMGMDPTSDLGQGVSSLLQGLYRMAPNVLGGVMGVGNPETMFKMALNGANGIGMASGLGYSSPLDPSGTLRSQERAMLLMRNMYEFSRKDGQPDASYTYGLNEDEMALVNQRILSSDGVYFKDRTKMSGERFDINNTDDMDEAGQKFSDRLKEMGEKINKAASSLAKITGSVESAMALMDEMAGGNFLGGTAQQASDIAAEAGRMASSIRLSSAHAGMSPREVFNVARFVRTGMASKSGLDPETANIVGGDGAFIHASLSAAAEFSNWAAMNPTATARERESAKLGFETKAIRYADSGADRMAAIVAGNRNLFTDEQVEEVRRAISEGRPNDVLQFVRDTVGHGRFDRELNSPAAIAAYRWEFSRDPKSAGARAYRDFNLAGMAGTSLEAAYEGVYEDINRTIGDLGLSSDAMTGIREERLKFAKRYAKDKLKWTEEKLAEYSGSDSVDRLERDIRESGGGRDFELSRGRKEIEIARNALAQEAVTGQKDQSAAVKRLQDAISNEKYGLDSELKEQLSRRLDAAKSGDGSWDEKAVNDVYKDFIGRLSREGAREVKGAFLGDKKRFGSDVDSARFNDAERMLDQRYTEAEVKEAAEMALGMGVNTEKFAEFGALLGSENGNDVKFLRKFMSTKEGKDESTAAKAAWGVFEKLVGNKLGDMDLRDLDDGTKERVGAEIVRQMSEGGMSGEEAAKSEGVRKIIEKAGGEKGASAADILKDAEFLDEFGGALSNALYDKIGSDQLKGLVGDISKSLGDKDITDETLHESIFGNESIRKRFTNSDGKVDEEKLKSLERSMREGLAAQRAKSIEGQKFGARTSGSANDAMLTANALRFGGVFGRGDLVPDASGAVAVGDMSSVKKSIGYEVFGIGEREVGMSMEGYVKQGLEEIAALQDALGVDASGMKGGVAALEEKLGMKKGGMAALAEGKTDSGAYKSAKAALAGKITDEAQLEKTIRKIQSLGGEGGLGLETLTSSASENEKRSKDGRNKAGFIDVAKTEKSGAFSEIMKIGSQVVYYLKLMSGDTDVMKRIQQGQEARRKGEG